MAKKWRNLIAILIPYIGWLFSAYYVYTYNRATINLVVIICIIVALLGNIAVNLFKKEEE